MIEILSSLDGLIRLRICCCKNVGEIKYFPVYKYIYQIQGLKVILLRSGKALLKLRVCRVSTERKLLRKNTKIFVRILQTFSRNFDFFGKNEFSEKMRNDTKFPD